MRSKNKQRPQRVRDTATERATDAHSVRENEGLDWEPLFKALQQSFDWSLDVAAALASDFAEDVEAVERVRTFMHAQLGGRTASVTVDDVLFTFALLIGAIERDLGTLGRRPWLVRPLPMGFPPAPELTPRVPRVVIARPSWSRGASNHFVD